MLFGTGAIILLERAEKRGAGIAAADIYYRRTLWLILFGLLHAHLIWSGDILFGYGVVGLLLFPLRKASARASRQAACIRSRATARAISTPISAGRSSATRSARRNSGRYSAASLARWA